LLFPSVAIVILNYNGKKFLEQFLPYVIASSYPNKKIIVSDNKSADNSLQFLKDNFQQIELIELEKNYGFAEGYNQTLKKINADYYVLLNSDVKVTDNWIEPIIELMEKDGNIAACQPKLLSYKKPENFEYAGSAGGWIDFLGYPFARGRIFNTVEKDNHQYDDVQQVFWAVRAAMFVRVKIYNELGGFDAFFFAHQEEIDLCWRMQLAGYKIMCCPASVVYHVGGGTLPIGHRKTFLNFRNNIIMLSKNLPSNEKLWKLPVRFLLDFFFAFQKLVSGDWNAFKAIFQSYWAISKWWLSKKKTRTLSKKPMKNLKAVYKESIVWKYFIENKKYFSEIVNDKKL